MDARRRQRRPREAGRRWSRRCRGRVCQNRSRRRWRWPRPREFFAMGVTLQPLRALLAPGFSVPGETVLEEELKCKSAAASKVDIVPAPITKIKKVLVVYMS